MFLYYYSEATLSIATPQTFHGYGSVMRSPTHPLLMASIRIIDFSLDGCWHKSTHLTNANARFETVNCEFSPLNKCKINTMSIWSVLLLFCRQCMRAACIWENEWTDRVCFYSHLGLQGNNEDPRSNIWVRGEILWPYLNPLSCQECITMTEGRTLIQLLHPRLEEGFWTPMYSWCEWAWIVKGEGSKLEECFFLVHRVGG